VDFVDSGLLGKVNLPPIPGTAQLSDPLAGRRTDMVPGPQRSRFPAKARMTVTDASMPTGSS
jgi:hypothetical protein